MKSQERFQFDPTQKKLSSFLSESSKVIELRRTQEWENIDDEGIFHTSSFSVNEVIAVHLVVSARNECEQDLETYRYLAEEAGFTKLQILELCTGTSADRQLKALVTVAVSILENRGFVDSHLMEEFYQVGWSKSSLIELIGLLCLCNVNNYLTNSKAA